MSFSIISVENLKNFIHFVLKSWLTAGIRLLKTMDILFVIICVSVNSYLILFVIELIVQNLRYDSI